MTLAEFDERWNSPKTKRIIGAIYSVGAAVVIIGALFKILHWTGASQVLMVGMFTEAFLFALGAFDRPFEEAHWGKIFDFKKGGFINQGGALGLNAQTPEKAAISALTGEEAKKLSEGIKHLSLTAEQLSSLSSVTASNEKLVKNLESASVAAGQYAISQDSLNAAAGQLDASYKVIDENVAKVEANTKTYAVRIDEINKNLASVNALYEIQLNNIKAQSEELTRQTAAVNAVTAEYSVISEGVKTMKDSAEKAVQQTAQFRDSSEKLAKQISDLNTVYGNMLNALH